MLFKISPSGALVDVSVALVVESTLLLVLVAEEEDVESHPSELPLSSESFDFDAEVILPVSSITVETEPEILCCCCWCCWDDYSIAWTGHECFGPLVDV